MTRDKKLTEALLEAPEIGRLNLGPVPTPHVSWDQPHEGNLFEFLYQRRAIADGAGMVNGRGWRLGTRGWEWANQQLQNASRFLGAFCFDDVSQPPATSHQPPVTSPPVPSPPVPSCLRSVFLYGILTIKECRAARLRLL